MQDLIKLANDNPTMEPLDALHAACSMMGAHIIAPRVTQDDDCDLYRCVEWDGRKWPLSYDGVRWGQGWI